jgi:hypothetical protein
MPSTLDPVILFLHLGFQGFNYISQGVYDFLILPTFSNRRKRTRLSACRLFFRISDLYSAQRAQKSAPFLTPLIFHNELNALVDYIAFFCSKITILLFGSL